MFLFFSRQEAKFIYGKTTPACHHFKAIRQLSERCSHPINIYAVVKLNGDFLVQRCISGMLMQI